MFLVPGFLRFVLRDRRLLPADCRLLAADFFLGFVLFCAMLVKDQK
jgi:hypothetical protein